MAKMTINGQTFEGSVDELVELIAKMDEKGSADLYIRTPGEVRLTTSGSEDEYKTVSESEGYEYLPKLSPDSKLNFKADVSTDIFVRPREGGEVRITANGSEKKFVLYGNKLIESPLNVFVKSAQPETITHEGVEYKRVDREAREGDVVVFDKSDNPEWLIVGGKPYEVVGESSAGRETFIGEDGDDYHVYSDMFANRTPANVKVYEPIVAKPAPPQVGDYAKVVAHNNDNGFGGAVGDIVKVIRVSNERYSVEELDGGSYHGNPHAKKEALVRATDEEVAEAERQQAEKVIADKWADIGREAAEFKKGDIVRIVASSSAQLNGTLGEVGEFDGKDSFRVLSPRFETANWQGPDTVELITPVEHRFDLPAGDSE